MHEPHPGPTPPASAPPKTTAQPSELTPAIEHVDDDDDTTRPDRVTVDARWKSYRSTGPHTDGQGTPCEPDCRCDDEQTLSHRRTIRL